MIEHIQDHQKIDRELAATVKELADFKFALDQSSIVAITDSKGTITYANDRFCEMSKYSREDLIGADHRILNSSYHPKSFFKDMWQTIKNGGVWSGEIKNRAKDGSFYWVKSTIIPFLNVEGLPYQYISIRQDITAQKEVEDQLRYHLYHDDLTGLRNRRCFKVELGQWLGEEDTGSIAIIYLDLDRFKYINDTLGHSAGDLILQSVSERLLRYLGEDKHLYRFGGDEFVIVLKNQSREEVTHFVEQITDLFVTPFPLYREKYYLSVSIGVSLFPQDGQDIETLTKNADSALYIAKEKGNTVKFHTMELQENMKKTMNIERELRQALDKEQFLLYYQPKVDLRTRTIVGVEALIRWNHPVMGILPPSEFIPLAEETGLIIPISEWVLETACRQNREWQDNGIPPLTVAVNLSPLLFRRKNLIDTIIKILQKTHLHPRYLELEITESSMENPERAIGVLKELKILGVHLSIDDFGTGYSSLAHLRRFPIDTLKIDRSFIEDISKDNGVMVRTIIDMAFHLGVNVIAEGIETDKQIRFLSQLQCNQGQGYLLSRPLSSQDLIDLLLNGNQLKMVNTSN